MTRPRLITIGWTSNHAARASTLSVPLTDIPYLEGGPT